MATGGECFSDSVEQSSDVTSSDTVYKFACTPCNENGNSSEALFKCLNCQNFLCINCYDGHNKFVKKHHIVNVNTKETGSRIIQMKGHTCEAHQEKLIEMYCKDHDAIFCSACRLKHRSCEGVDYIPDIAGSLLQAKLKNAVKHDLENISTELLKTKSSRQTILSKMNIDKYKTINEMKQCKERLLKRIEEWEQSSLLNVEEKYQDINTNVTSDLRNINHMLHDVEKQLSKMRAGKFDDDIDEVVTLKISERQVKAVRPRISEYMWKPVQHVVFKPIYWIELQKNVGDISVSKRAPNAVYICHTSLSLTFVNDELVPGLLNVGIRSKCIQKYEEIDADVTTVHVVSDVSDLWSLDLYLFKKRCNFTQKQTCKRIILCLLRKKGFFEHVKDIFGNESSTQYLSKDEVESRYQFRDEDCVFINTDGTSYNREKGKAILFIKEKLED